MRGIAFAVLALVLRLPVAAQLVSVHEPGIRVAIPTGPATVTIPVDNPLRRTAKGTLVVSWLDVSGKESPPLQREIELPHGRSEHAFALPLASPSVWTRLRYSLTPDRAAARDFPPRSGIVSLAHVSPDVFEVKISHPGYSLGGAPFLVHAVATHPVTRLPVSGVEWSGTLEVDDKQVRPSSIRNLGDGFVEIRFDPAAPYAEASSGGDLTITARRGGFEAEAEASPNFGPGLTALIQTDKPIYQPGQTVRVRAVVTGPDGRAASGAKVVIKIESDRNGLTHTVERTASRHGVIQDEWRIPDNAEPDTLRVNLLRLGTDYPSLAIHWVRLSRYELPAFTVTAKPDRAYYTAGQRASLTVNAAYLFGKPVPKAEVRVMRDDVEVAKGTAADDGNFTAQLDMPAEAIHEWQRFQDIRFAAFVKDPSTGRTAQREFRIRVTRDPIHIYPIALRGLESGQASLYVSASYADGRPAPATITWKSGAASGEIRTNRYGVGKGRVSDDFTGGSAEWYARDAAGLEGKRREQFHSTFRSKVAVEARRTVHRAGEPVVLQVTGAEDIPATAAIIVTATVDRKTVASRTLRLSGRKAEVTFPFQPEFARLVTFAAWSPDSGESRPGFAAVVYPDHTPLRLATATDRREYKPGENGTLTVRAADLAGKPVEAALGIALVDQAVLERARTDQEFGARPWFACAYCSDDGEADIGGVRLNDLISGTGPVPPDLDLAAEALAARFSPSLERNRSDSLEDPPGFESIKAQAQRWKEGLDRYHAGSFDYPRDGADLARLLQADWLSARDPWDQPYFARSSYSGQDFTIEVRTAGPDKKSGTPDDFTAATFEWPYFRPAERLIQEILARQPAYPGSPEELIALLRVNGLDLERLRDPWGSPYRAGVETVQRVRNVVVMTNGPDRMPETDDDAMVSLLSGSYFIHGRAISRALRDVSPPPRTEEQFRQALAAAKIDIDSLRDAWGRAYTIHVKEEAAFSDRMVTRNVRVFGQEEVTKEEHIPVTRHTTVFRLHSAGPDGKPGNDDDFDIATFPVFVSQEAARKDAASPPAMASSAGVATGEVAGRVADVTGAGIPNATVVLIASDGGSQRTLTAEDGVFRFTLLPVGTYSLVADLAGFVRHETPRIPVDAGKVTPVEIELRVGAVMEQVQVYAEPAALNTESATLTAVQGPTSTPRVREFFPETLLWLPEVITNANGLAKIPVRFADSITTWKLAVFASTLDGRTATVESDIRVFQPFFLDFDLPKVLTQGDRIELPVSIRNYLTRTARVQLDARAGAGLSLPESRTQTLDIPAEGSRSVPLVLTAPAIASEASLRATAKGGRDGDAVERRVRIQPDGREVRTTSADLASGTLALPFSIPRDAIAGSTSVELRIYPNVGSLLIESAASVLSLPRGCAEQMISAGYANLVAWRFAKSSGMTDAPLEERLLQNVRAAVDGLGRFRSHSGAFSYWGDEPDTAVTAHALAFLIEASEVTGRDEHRIESAAQYLERAQQKDGRWIDTRAGPGAGERISLLLTAAVARSLALAVKSGVKVDPKVLTGAYHHLAKFTDSVDEPYLLARFVSAVLDSGDRALAANAAARLQALAREERGATYWDLQTNTPFYGWGTAGRVETTGAVVSALAAWRAANPDDRALDPLLRRAIVFLVRQRRSGYWPSTQSTLLAMRAIADAAPVLGFGDRNQSGPALAIRLDGKVLKSIGVPRGAAASDPILIPWDGGLSAGEHQAVVEAPQLALVSLTSAHSVAWTGTAAPPSPDLRFSVEFNRLDPLVGESVRCKVRAERVGFRGYGMLIAEVGLPPGAEVDRASLEKVADRYEILPDRVVFYLWPSAGDVTFEFDLGVRFPMTAKSAASVLYDYNNPEARSVVPPSLWRVSR